jgi:hypothetical protein
MISRPAVVAAGLSEWLVWYGLGLVVVLIAASLLLRANRRAGTMAFRIVTWSLVGGVGGGLPLPLIVIASGNPFGSASLLVSIPFSSIPVFVMLTIGVSALRLISSQGFEAFERVRWWVGAIVVFVASAACSWAVIVFA